MEPNHRENNPRDQPPRLQPANNPRDQPPRLQPANNPRDQPPRLQPANNPRDQPPRLQPANNPRDQPPRLQPANNQQMRTAAKRKLSPAPDNNHRHWTYEPYWPSGILEQSIGRSELIVGPLCITSPKFASVENEAGSKILVLDLKDRNRALHGDVVAVKAHCLRQWRVCVEEYVQYARSLPEGDQNFTVDVLLVDGGAYRSYEDMPGDSHVKRQKMSQDAQVARTQPADSYSDNSQFPDRQEDGLQAGGGARQFPGRQRSCVPLAYMLQKGNLWTQDFFKKSNLINLPFVQKTGRVVGIYEMKNHRIFKGHIRLTQDKFWAQFIPCNPTIPHILISKNSCPPGFLSRPADFARSRFYVSISSWDESSILPKGRIFKTMQHKDMMEPESSSLLQHAGISDAPFSEAVLQCLPPPFWTIPDSEVSRRRDMRGLCVFSIDPLGCKDLDDALSIEDIGDGKYQVGVHIADVSFFVREGSLLDEEAYSRAMSVNLIQKVIPMIPLQLCEDQCSLLQGKDRLTFSVIWIMDDQGKIYDVWFGKTVVRSCASLSYDQAQSFIDQPNQKENGTQSNQDRTEFSQISNSFQVQDIRTRILLLDKITKSCRQKRLDDGALSWATSELQYTIDQETLLPTDCVTSQKNDSKRLVEELMLLTNTSVAKKITGRFPKQSILVMQPSPDQRSMDNLRATFAKMGFNIDTSSSTALLNSVAQSCGDDEFSDIRQQFFMKIISQRMQSSRYVCSGTCSANKCQHYALNVPLYTHFTSPIRRYPDILVHRMLTAALDDSYLLYHKGTELLQTQADFCNNRQRNIRQMVKRNSQLYLMLFLKEKGAQQHLGVVWAVQSRGYDIFIPRLGQILRADFLVQKTPTQPTQPTQAATNQLSSPAHASSGTNAESLPTSPEMPNTAASSGSRTNPSDMVLLARPAEPSSTNEEKADIPIFTLVRCSVLTGEVTLKCSCKSMKPQVVIESVLQNLNIHAPTGTAAVGRGVDAVVST